MTHWFALIDADRRTGDTRSTSVLADALITAGDPLGELMSLSLSGANARTMHEATLRVPSLFGGIEVLGFEWRRGVIVSAHLRADDTTRLGEVLALRWLERLSVDSCAANVNDICRLPCLQHLSWRERDRSQKTMDGFSTLHGALRSLALESHLTVHDRAMTAVLASPVFPKLESLTLGARNHPVLVVLREQRRRLARLGERLTLRVSFEIIGLGALRKVVPKARLVGITDLESEQEDLWFSPPSVSKEPQRTPVAFLTQPGWTRVPGRSDETAHAGAGVALEQIAPGRAAFCGACGSLDTRCTYFATSSTDLNDYERQSFETWELFCTRCRTFTLFISSNVH